MMERMEGQDRSMYPHAYQACRDEFPLPEPEKVDITDQHDKIDWAIYKHPGREFRLARGIKPHIEFRVLKNVSDFVVRKAIVVYSEDSCQDSTPDDFHNEMVFDLFLPPILSDYYGSEYIRSASNYDHIAEKIACIKLIKLIGESR